MYLVVGLGNPGKQYEATRHNMGFDTVDRLVEDYNVPQGGVKFNAMYGKTMIGGEKVILMKPLSFMNLSGGPVREMANYFKIDPESELIVIYDDIDLEPGIIRIRKSGGPGTHNGMKSVVQCLGASNFSRVRVGIGKPRNHSDLIEYVIGAIPEEDKEKLKAGIIQASDAVCLILKENIDIAMNKFN